MTSPLVLCVLAPAVAAVLAMLAPSRAARWLALLASALPLLVGTRALLDFARHPGADFRMQASVEWSREFGAAFTVGVDGFGAAMLALTGLVVAIATILAWKEQRHPRAYHALVMLLLSSTCGVFVSLDLLAFYVAWEVMLAPMLVLIGIWGGEQRRYAALKFFAFTLAGSLAMLALLIALWQSTPAEGRAVEVDAATVTAYSTDGGRSIHGLTLSAPTDSGTRTTTVPRDFDIRHLALQWRAFETGGGLSLAALGFLAVLLASLVKLPAVPLHTWLPHAHVQAPTAISVLLAGILLKLGVFGLHRLAWPLFPAQVAAHAVALGVIGVIGILWGAWVALGQGDLKRLVAYSSVSHMGFALLGFAALTGSGLIGGSVQAVTHGLSSSLAFLLVGVVYDRAHHRRIDGFGGLARPMPRFAWLLLIAALAGAGLPATAGFVGEFLVLCGGFTGGGSFPVLAAIATLAVIVGAAYLLWMVKRVVYGPLRHEQHARFSDCDARELTAALPLVALIVALGVWPSPLVDALRPSAEYLAEHVRSALR
ncbi:MAG: NADH-quinone oxidoreductase subunit M [Planctomycetota bacterium]